MMQRVDLESIPTGVPGFDVLLNGGIPRYSFNVLTGAPGTGKTTLAHQMMFKMAGPATKVLYFTIIGEPPLKMLRYQQQYAFFDSNKVGACIKYVNLADDLNSGNVEGVLERILTEVQHFDPQLVFVDSFKSMVYATHSAADGLANIQYFVQRLGMHMTSWQATTFLIGEYVDAQREADPIFTVADNVIHLSQELDNNAVLRKLRIVKMRGKAHMLGLHSFRMSTDGLHVYPRMVDGMLQGDTYAVGKCAPDQRLSSGSTSLDALLHGGVPKGYSVIVVGPPGSGKTMLASSFLSAGAQAGEVGVLASFEDTISCAANLAIAPLVANGSVRIVRPSSLDLSIEELGLQLLSAVDEAKASRLVIDSLPALQMTLAQQYRQNFEESLFRLLAAFSKKGVTVLIVRNSESASFAQRQRTVACFLVDCIIATRYVEQEGRMVKLLTVEKLRGTSHSADVRPYTVDDRGVHIAGG